MSVIPEQKVLRVRCTAIFLLTALISCFLPVATIACPLELPTTTVSINGHGLIVELAFTPEFRSCGLSHRHSLESHHGMLFVFPKADPRRFWMKDTWMPLSAAFIDDSGKIINIEKMTPDQTTKQYLSHRPALYVLEVNQGWFDAHGVQTGDTVVMELPLMLNVQ